MELKIVNEQIFTAFTYLIVDFNLLLNNIEKRKLLLKRMTN